MKAMFERFRFWVANAICPPVTVLARYRGRIHVVKNVKLAKVIRVDTPDIEKINKQQPPVEIPGTVAEGQGEGVPLKCRPWPQEDVDTLRKKVAEDHATGRTDGFGRFIPPQEVEP